MNFNHFSVGVVPSKEYHISFNIINNVIYNMKTKRNEAFHTGRYIDLL